MQNQKNLPKTRPIFEVANLGTPKIPQPVTNLKRVATPYIPFGDQNDFPQNVAELCRESATLGAIIASKGDFAAGDSFQIISNPSIEAFCKKINGKNQNLTQFMELIFIDYYLSGNAYIRVCRPINSKILAEYSIEHIPQHTIRLASKTKGFYYATDWTQRINIDEVIGEFPNFTPIDETYEQSIIHLKDYVPGFDFYGLPTFMGAMQYAKLEYLIGLYNNNQFDNQMLPSGILEVVTANMEEADAKRFIGDIKNKYTNVEKGNNGKILVVSKDSNESKASFTPISQEQEGSFKELKAIATETIITACQWFPSLAGIATEGKLGSNQQIAQEFEIAIRHVGKLQNKFKEAFRAIINLTNSEDFDLKIITNKPGNATKLTEKVNSDQIVAFRDLLNAAIDATNDQKKKAISNAFVILFGFTKDEANSMIYGTDIINIGK